jgi:hypothetical protein
MTDYHFPQMEYYYYNVCITNNKSKALCVVMYIPTPIYVDLAHACRETNLAGSELFDLMNMIGMIVNVNSSILNQTYKERKWQTQQLQTANSIIIVKY